MSHIWKPGLLGWSFRRARPFYFPMVRLGGTINTVCATTGEEKGQEGTKGLDYKRPP